MTPPRNKQAPRRPSLHDVAKMAGVSAAAVSYVVNGRTGEVGPETRQRIAGAIKILKYQPQRRGLSLKFNREYAIGLVVLNADPSFLADPFTTQVATGLSNALAEPGFGLTVTGCRTLKGLETLLQRPIGVDAYVAMASGSAAMRARSYRMLSDLNLPVIVVQEGVPRGIGDACAVLQDDFGGAQVLTRQLAATGARRFLWVVPSRSWPAIERREKGIRSALPPDAVLLKVACDERDFGATIAAIEGALDCTALPDAIMGANDQIAIAALKVLARRGIQVPQGIQVTGYNDFHFRNYASPLLTTITSPAEAIGLRGAQAILSRLDAGAFPTRTIELPVQLNLGETTLPAGEAPHRD